MRNDGGVRVINRGYSDKENRWKEAEGKAYFVGSPDVGFLKVSFFGPFYGSYIVLDLDREYRHALVCGPDRSYLWILSRTPELDVATRDKMTAKARDLGFDTTKLIWVRHDSGVTGK
jgi:apolipoprotein D and lipocalin family protein